MVRTVRKFVALFLAVCMLFSMMITATAAVVSPGYQVSLIPGKTTKAESKIVGETGTTYYTLTVDTKEVETTHKQTTVGELKAPQSALKFDRNSTADQTAQRKVRDLYTDNGHFTDPASVTVTDAPEGYPFQYIGTGDYSGHYVSHVRVIYDREDNGEPKVDENGNYVIKELQHANGTPLTIDLQPTTSFEGPYDQTTGTRPLQFLLKDEAGNTVYGYCIDLETGAEVKKWYAVANLEDNEYYASQDAEDHVRGIISNGYWGTAEGTGSLTQLKASLKAALAADEIDKIYDVNFRNRATNSGQELAENQYASTNYVYTKLNQKVTLTDEIIDGLTEGEALDAMQCAIWSWANGSNATLDGVDGMIVGDLYYASSAMGDSRNGANDFEGAARTKALYTWLMQQTAEADSVIINDKTFADNITLSLGDVNHGVYDASVSFTIADYEATSGDELVVALTYDGANGAPVTIEKPITGEGALEAVNGVYTIDGLYLREDDPFNFTLNIHGKQQLTKNAYIYTSEGGIGASQTMVGMAEGAIQIDVTKSFDSKFTVTEKFVPHKDEPGVGTKQDELINRDENRYEVTIDVPGKDGDKRHDEVILMVDGSTSVDGEWPAMRDAVLQIGKDFLNGSGTTQLTLMAFGISPTVVKEHVTSYEELEALLDQYQGNLLYGRSGTNCSAAFDGIREYIAEHDETLKDSFVIYISDGRVNLNNALYWWKDCVSNVLTVGNAANAVAEEVMGEYDFAEPSAAYLEVFGDKRDELTAFAETYFTATDKATKNAAINGILAIANEKTESGITKAQLWASLVFEDVFEFAGLEQSVKYPMHVVEKAFVDYTKETNTYCQEAFYCTAVSMKDNYNHTANGKACAISAGQAAAEVANEIFLIRYNPDYRSDWMDNIGRDNVTVVDAGSVKNVASAVKDSVKEYTVTPYNDVYVTDYMSKWVNFIPGTEKIIDNITGETIWSRAEGWKITEGRPTAQENPVIVEKVDPSDYAAGGADVIDNTNGDIYKLTWYVKDGAMLRSDNYRLAYEVTVDTKEEGFVYKTELPANGNTDLHYKDSEGKDKVQPIEVPTVNAERVWAEMPVKKVGENGEPLTGATFELYASDENGTKGELLGTYTVDEDGEMVLEMKSGYHLLVETVAPSGYLTPAEDIHITVGNDLESFTVAENKAASFENGVLTVTNSRPHAAVVLTIDMSGTMYRNKMDGKRYVDVAKAKAVDFVKQYAATANNGGKRMLAVVCFDTDAKIQQNWIDVSTTANLNAAVKAINNIKVADNGSASSNQVCTNFDGGVILSRNLLKQDAVKDIERSFAIILSDGAPTVTVNQDTDKVATIKSSFWGNQLDANGKKYQNARCGGGWTHPAEVANTLTYMNGLKDLTCSYTVNGEEKEGIFIVGVGGLMNFKLFNDAVYGTSNGSRTSDVKKKPAAFNNIDALSGYTQTEILKLTTGDWMSILAGKVGGTYESAKNTDALQNQFTNIMEAIKANTTAR